MSAELSGVDLSGAFPVQVRSYADQEAEIARLTSAFARVIGRLESEVARLERELRVERAITRHDAEVRALRPEHEEEER